MPVKHSHTISGAGVVSALMPVMAAVLVGFIIIGVALPVLPLHVKNDLGFGTFIVGLVAGAQFAASLISRVQLSYQGYCTRCRSGWSVFLSCR